MLFRSAGTQAKSASALCAFAAATGHGTVPSSVLKAVQAVGGAGTTFVVSSSARRVSTIDGWLISVSLSSYGLKPGGLATGTLVIQ